MKHPRDSPAYRAFASAVFKRDGGKCVICGSTWRINAHHLNGWNWYPQGRYDPNNAVTLCSGRNGCHTMFHKMYGRGNNTRAQFDLFKHYQKNNKKKKR